MSAREAIERAERILPGNPAPEGELDPRWQAVIEVEEYVQEEPEAVWPFVARWGRHEDEDLRTAIATCLLEHLLEYHFDRFFPKVEEAVRADARFADTFSRCSKFGESEQPDKAASFDRLKTECRSVLANNLSGLLRQEKSEISSPTPPSTLSK